MMLGNKVSQGRNSTRNLGEYFDCEMSYYTGFCILRQRDASTQQPWQNLCPFRILASENDTPDTFAAFERARFKDLAHSLESVVREAAIYGLDHNITILVRCRSKNLLQGELASK